MEGFCWLVGPSSLTFFLHISLSHYICSEKNQLQLQQCHCNIDVIRNEKLPRKPNTRSKNVVNIDLSVVLSVYCTMSCWWKMEMLNVLAQFNIVLSTSMDCFHHLLSCVEFLFTTMCNSFISFQLHCLMSMRIKHDHMCQKL